MSTHKASGTVTRCVVCIYIETIVISTGMMLHHHQIPRLHTSTSSAHLTSLCIHSRRPIVTCSVLSSTNGPIQINTSPSARSPPIISSSAQGPSSPLTLVNGWPATSSIDDSLVLTKFIAETLLPTRHGIFRLRGYKHSVGEGTPESKRTAHAIMCLLLLTVLACTTCLNFGSLLCP